MRRQGAGVNKTVDTLSRSAYTPGMTTTTTKRIRKGTIGRLQNVPTGFPAGQDLCRYAGRVNGWHAFESMTVNQTAFLTDDQLTKATWTRRAR